MTTRQQTPTDWVVCVRMDAISIACERGRVPALWGEPFVIASSDAVVRAVSPECQPFGITAGSSTQTARSLCQGLIVVPYQEEAYLRAAESIWQLLAVETSIVEPISPEVVFAEFRGEFIEVRDRVRYLAAKIMETARTEVKVGLGRSKLVAAHAARQDRESIVVPVRLGMEAAAIAAYPIAELGRLTPKLVAHLEKRGVKTLGDVARLPASALGGKLNESWHLLRMLAFGEDGDRVKPLWPKPSVEQSLRFDDEVSDEAQIAHGLQRLAERVSGELMAREAKGEGYCRSLSLKVGLASGQYLSQDERLVCPTHAADQLYAASRRLFERLKPQIDQPVIELIVTASHLERGASSQLTFAGLDDESAKRERQATLDQALSRLYRKYGPRAVISASLLAQAKRIHLWTYSFARQRSERVHVYTDRKGTPVRYLRARKQGRSSVKEVDTYEVTDVLDSWIETDWKWGDLLETECWRVEASPSGIHELHRIDVRWHLQAESD